MGRKINQKNQSHNLIEESHKFSDDYLTTLLNKAEIVLRSIKSTRLRYGKE